MARPIVILADTDEDYMSALEMKFIEEFGEKIDLEVITEKLYFEEFFHEIRTIEVLIVGESLYSSAIKEQNIENIFVLKEGMNGTVRSNSTIQEIFKYSSTGKIYQQVIETNRRLAEIEEEKNDDKTKVVVVYSPVGGAGKTTLALGIAACFAKNRQKVLYINAERMNTFQCNLQDETTIPNNDAIRLADDTVNLYVEVKSMIRTEVMDYLSPFGAIISALNLEYSIYNKIIDSVRKEKEYDFVIVDTDTVFDMDKAEMFTKADRIVLVGNQTKQSEYAIKVLERNIDCSNNEKYVYVCNCYEGTGEGEDLLTIQNDSGMCVNVGKIKGMDKLTLESLAEQKDIQKLALLII